MCSHHPPCVLWQNTLLTYLEMEDDRPDEPQGELGVAVCNVIVANVHQFHLKEKQQSQISSSASPTERRGTCPQPGCPQGHPQHSTGNTLKHPGASKRRSKASPSPGSGRIFHLSSVLHLEVLSQHLTALFQITQKCLIPEAWSTSA